MIKLASDHFRGRVVLTVSDHSYISHNLVLKGSRKGTHIWCRGYTGSRDQDGDKGLGEVQVEEDVMVRRGDMMNNVWEWRNW